jgi:hypothetical protein
MPDQTNTTNITPPRVPMVDPDTGLITRDWYRFFTSLFRLTGNGENTTTLADVQIGPDAGTDSGMAVLMTQIEDLAVSPTYTPQLPRHRYGSFSDSTTQTAAAINTAYAVTFNTSDYTAGVTLGTPTSQVYVDAFNIYNIQFSAQINTTVATDQLVWIWMRKNGTDIPNSTGQIRTKGNNYAAIVSWNFLVELNQGDYFELMWATDSTGVRLEAFSGTAVYPAVPSVALSVTNNINSEGPY